MEHIDKMGRRHFILAGCVGDGPFTPFFSVRRGRADQEEPLYMRDFDDPSWRTFPTLPEATQDATARAVEWIEARADADAAAGTSGDALRSGAVGGVPPALSMQLADKLAELKGGGRIASIRAGLTGHPFRLPTSAMQREPSSQPATSMAADAA